MSMTAIPPIGLPPSSAAAIATSTAMRAAIPSLKAGAKVIAAVFGAGALVAAQQLAYEEGRSMIGSIRDGIRQRRDRNGMIVLAAAGAALPLEIQDTLRRSRDAYAVALRIVTDRSVQSEHRDLLRTTLQALLQG